MPRKQVARELGVSYDSVKKYATTPAPVKDLTPQQVEEIRQYREDGVPYNEIARTTGVTWKTIQKHFGPSPYRRGELVGFYNEVRRLEGRGSFAPFGDVRSGHDN